MEMSGYIYLCSAGESFDSIALAVYADGKHTPALIRANPQYADVLIFSGGEALELPVVTVPEGTDSEAQTDKAPWKE